MSLHRQLHPSDLQGLARLAGDGVAGTSELVEQLHLTIARAAWPVGPAVKGTTRGVTGLVYRSIRGVTALVGTAVDSVADPLVRRLPVAASSPTREQWLAALNGVLGDHLARSGNPLAIPMTFRKNGQALALDGDELAPAYPNASGRLLVSVHGLCMNDRHWRVGGDRPGIPERLGRVLGASTIDLHYNSGRPIEDNGGEFAEGLERLVSQWPVAVEQIIFVGHSMGGLVTRSALQHGRRRGHAWPDRAGRVAFLGTPHHGSPVERAGHRVDRALGLSPYSAPFTRLGMSRSAGITDLRHGLPLPADELEGRRCLAVAATARPALARAGRILGDGLVPVDSALGRQDPARALPIDEADCHVVADAGHFGLLHSPQVYRILRRWLSS